MYRIKYTLMYTLIRLTPLRNSATPRQTGQTQRTCQLPGLKIGVKRYSLTTERQALLIGIDPLSGQAQGSLAHECHH